MKAKNRQEFVIYMQEISTLAAKRPAKSCIFNTLFVVVKLLEKERRGPKGNFVPFPILVLPDPPEAYSEIGDDDGCDYKVSIREILYFCDAGAGVAFGR